MSNIELLNKYYNQTADSSTSAMYTEHDDSHWDQDSYDDWDFDGNSTTGGEHADEHSDRYYCDD